MLGARDVKIALAPGIDGLGVVPVLNEREELPFCLSLEGLFLVNAVAYR